MYIININLGLIIWICKHVLENKSYCHYKEKNISIFTDSCYDYIPLRVQMKIWKKIVNNYLYRKKNNHYKSQNEYKFKYPESGLSFHCVYRCVCTIFCFLAHLSRRLKWVFLITVCSLSVVRRRRRHCSCCCCKLFTF